jgi:hypothetical protein
MIGGGTVNPLSLCLFSIAVRFVFCTDRFAMDRLNPANNHALGGAYLAE